MDSLHSKVASNNLDTQKSKSVVVFVNGNYYGIYQLLEVLSDEYISNHYCVDENDVEAFKTLDYDFNELFNDHYTNILDYSKSNDLSCETHYNYIEQRVDIENLLEYFVFQMYIGNTDWPAANNMIWRVLSGDNNISDNRYRYLLYDTDCGMNSIGDFRFNEMHPTIFHWVFENKYPLYIEKEVHSLYIIEELIKNESFRNSFINKFCDRVNKDYKPEVFYDYLNSFVNELSGEKYNDIIRYNYLNHDINTWYLLIDTYKKYVANRHITIFEEMSKYFECEIAYLTLNKSEGGFININSNIDVCKQESFSGKYMSGYDITLTAIEEEGYKFIGWSDGVKSKIRTICFSEEILELDIAAIFERVK